MGFLESFSLKVQAFIMTVLVMFIAVAPVITNNKFFKEYMPVPIYGIFEFVGQNAAMILTVCAFLLIYRHIKDIKILILIMIIVFYILNAIVAMMHG